MSHKSKGINAERDLIHRFWNIGSWMAVRIAGSGSMRYPSADIIASNKHRRLAIECKSTKKNRKYFSKDDINQLKEFAERFGAEPWIAVKFKRKGWFFILIEDLNKSGKNFYISDEIASKKGYSIKDLTKNYEILR